MNNIIPTPGDFKADEKIRFWAKLIRICSFVLFGLSAVTAIVLLCMELFLVAIFAFVGGGVSCIGGMIFSALMWGFADIVESAKNPSGGTTKVAPVEDELPEL